MEAIRIDRTGGPDVLELREVDDPVAGPTDVVVEIASAGVNFIDTYFRSGLYPRDLPSGLGQEGAGTVVAVGTEVSARRVGDRVAWAGTTGSYATHLVVPADETVAVPDGVALDIAAAVLLQGMTAHYLSQSTTHLGEDDTVLVYAAAGGVGRLLVQLAKRRGARVLACTSTADKAAEVLALGADEIIFYRDVDVPTTVRELTDGHGVDVVYDSVGADTFEGSLDALRPRGLLVSFGNSSGPPPLLELRTLAQKGSLYVTRPTLGHYTATPDELDWRAGSLFDLIENGHLQVKVHARYPLAEAARAHQDLESGETSGKLLLQP